MRYELIVGCVGALVTAAFGSINAASTLYVGTAVTDITPSKPVAVSGQFNLRIARDVESPVTANVIVVESRQGNVSVDTAVMVAVDVVSIPTAVLEMVREEVNKRNPDLDARKLFLNATHTHTGPVLLIDKYRLPEQGVIQVAEYREFFAERIADAVSHAWKHRQPGSVTWGLSHAVVAYNRRAVYADGSAKMYGRTDVPHFRNLEGYEDHDVNTLFFFGEDESLVGIAINVSCPSQEVEGRSTVNADFWHPVRAALRSRYGPQLAVLGWTGASGDQSPHLMYRKAADERMRKLRGLSRLDEIARRVVRSVEEAYEVVKNDRHLQPQLVHHVEDLKLPMRLVNDAEYAEADEACRQAKSQLARDPGAANRVYRRMKWYQVTVDRFEAQKTDPKPMYDMELHVIRLGDVVICTNAFELFTDFGIRIKARSPATQTLVVQLVGPGSYVPTSKAVGGGHYSAVVHSSLVGPEGGQILVDRTVDLIRKCWKE